jgi:hypothetical protein
MKKILLLLSMTAITLTFIGCSNILEQPINYNYKENSRREARINHSSDNVARMDSSEHRFRDVLK